MVSFDEQKFFDFNLNLQKIPAKIYQTIHTVSAQGMDQQQKANKFDLFIYIYAYNAEELPIKAYPLKCIVSSMTV